jgi:gliding motility-associated protein GldC
LIFLWQEFSRSKVEVKFLSTLVTYQLFNFHLPIPSIGITFAATTKFCNYMSQAPQSVINIAVELDQDRLPENIKWTASGSTADTPQSAKAMMLSMWDAADKSALRIDLWTKDMMVDEMTDFFYQSMMAMADTYQRATAHAEMTKKMKEFAQKFYQEARNWQKPA